MQTYLITSHGAHCPTNKKKAEVITLPDNVIVVMNCYDSYMYAAETFEAACWAFMADKDLHLSMKKKRMRIKNIAKYFESLAKLTGSEVENNLCIFVDKCPNLELSKEKVNWRSAVVRAPVKIVLKDYATGLHQEISHDLLKKISRNQKLTYHEKILEDIWLKPYKEREYVYKHEKLSIKPAVIYFDENSENITLKQFIKETSESDPETMHMILVTACRSPELQVEMKLRQYQTKYQPYESLLVFYDKLMKLREKNNL